jgi:hypothetical protein
VVRVVAVGQETHSLEEEEVLAGIELHLLLLVKDLLIL